MGRAWLQTHTDDGTRSWDQTLGRMMFVVLIGAANLRAGELVRSQHYTGEEYLKWEHIAVRLHDGPDVDDENPRLQDIEVIIELHFIKAFKDFKNGPTVRYLRPLTDARY